MKLQNKEVIMLRNLTTTLSRLLYLLKFYTCILLFDACLDVMCILLFDSFKEIYRLISKGMSNIYYWEKLRFSKLRFARKENLKKCTNFGEQKGTSYTRRNFYFGIIFFNCLSSTKQCLRFHLICFAREIKSFYQSSLGNKVGHNERFPKYLG